MELLKQIKKLPFMENQTDDALLATMEKMSQPISLKKGEHLVKQFDLGEYIFFLLSGELSASIPLRDAGKEYNVGLVNEVYAPVGWSAFRYPSRYATTYSATKKTTLIRFSVRKLKRTISKYPEFGNRLLQYIYQSSIGMLEAIHNQTRPFLANESLAFDETRPLVNKQFLPLSKKDALQKINQASFFEGFTIAEKQAFSKHMQMMLVSQGDIISQQDQNSDGLYLLLRGKVIVSYQTEHRNIITTRTIVRTGTLFNWSTLGEAQLKNRTSIIASRDSTIMYLSRERLVTLLCENKELSHKYWYRLIWLVGAHLLSARMRFLSQSANDEVLAVGNVVDQNAALLPVSSPLYKVQELLKSPTTTDDAFAILYKSLHFGATLERSIAGMCLDILKDVQRENGFYRHLQHAYDHITHLPDETPTIDVARAGSELFKQIFEKVPYVIKGLENLPKQAGCLFIYNHLNSSKSTLLPNGFRFPLDAQFIGSMIIDKQYGISGLRVVRRSKGDEYWRDAYYQRFGYLFVDSWDELSQDKKSYTEFLAATTATLQQNTPLLMAPEGAKFDTKHSPGPLRASAFEIAQQLPDDEEPWIVPIAVANFDKRVDHTIYSVVIKPAFKLSSRVDKQDSASMNTFLAAYQTEFRQHVEEAIELASTITTAPYLSSLSGFCSNLHSLNQLESEFESDVRALEFRISQTEKRANPVVFYGSSSFTLWHNINNALQQQDLINLGFSAATIDACIYYFERLVVPQNPKSIVLYAGDNDLGNRKSSNKVIELYIALLEKIDQHFAGIPVAIVAIKPSPARQHLLTEIKQTNQMLARLAKTRPNTKFVDLYAATINESGLPDPTLFDNDSLHLNEKGYKALSACLLDYFARL
ncbi:cyclic nucleotide-binding domain-containing protein [Marinomonas agarivorans]|nr:cyclic nucleotide-binding domain-containing protein [Marinomonas agarivorans]